MFSFFAVGGDAGPYSYTEEVALWDNEGHGTLDDFSLTTESMRPLNSVLENMWVWVGYWLYCFTVVFHGM